MGAQALGSETAKQPVAEGGVLAPVLPAPVLEGLRPNATYYYRLAGYDANVQSPEAPLSSETGSFATPFVAARVVGEPSASFVKSTSVVMSGELNPENASTRYFFEYGPCHDVQACAGSSYPNSTTAQKSAAYGRLGATLEAVSLTPGTVYHYRLAAVSENGAKTKTGEARGPEGVFTTGAPPALR